jgi:hypothetical protein
MREGLSWRKENTNIFWGEIAPCEHVLQVYDTDKEFFDLLEGFATSGFKSNECVIVIATDAHLKSLEERLWGCGLNLIELKQKGLFMPLNAEDTLSQFMVDGWPDEKLFTETISQMLKKARANGFEVRAFGEMVAILWAQGNSGATVHLEHLWNKFCANETFCLFCAYPKSGFTGDANESLKHICKAHSKIVAANNGDSTRLSFSPVLG